MEILEVAGEIVGTVFRKLFGFFAEIVFEILIKWMGYLVCRIFTRRVDPEGLRVTLVGIASWCVIGVVLYGIYQFF